MLDIKTEAATNKGAYQFAQTAPMLLVYTFKASFFMRSSQYILMLYLANYGFVNNTA